MSASIPHGIQPSANRPASSSILGPCAAIHTSGCRGFADIIPHALGLDELRDVARRVPAGLLEEFLVIGNAAEIGEQLGRYAAGGLSHVALADMTGMVQGIEDMPRAMAQVGELVGRLHGADLATVKT